MTTCQPVSTSNTILIEEKIDLVLRSIVMVLYNHRE